MAKLTGQTIADSYDQLLIVTGASGITSSLQAVESADTGSSSSALSISTVAISVDGNTTITTADNTDTLTLISTDADASVGPNLRLYRNSSSPVDDDFVGEIHFQGRNDNSEDVIYGRFLSRIKDASVGSEDGLLHIGTMVEGTARSRIEISPTEVIFNDDSIDIDFRVESNGNANALLLDGATGAVTMAEQPAFLAHPALAQNNIAADNSAVTIVYGTEIFDQGGDFTGNTFTAPVTGKYQFNVLTRLENVDTASTYYRIILKTSNREIEISIFDPDGLDSDPTYWNLSGSVLADMDVSDTAYMIIHQASGTAQTDIATDSTFSGFLAC